MWTWWLLITNNYIANNWCLIKSIKAQKWENGLEIINEVIFI